MELAQGSLEGLLRLAILTIMSPELAKIPGNGLGFVCRTMASRVRDVCNTFWTSLLEEIGELATDTVAWTELAPSRSGGDEAVSAGAIAIWLHGALALRAARFWN